MRKYCGHFNIVFRGESMLIDFSNWIEYEGASEGSGRSEKIWLINPNTKKVGLFKFTKTIETKEHVSEKLAKDIADIIQLECANIDLGTYNNRIGCMSYLINDNDVTLIEGIYLINREYPYFNPDKLYDQSSNEYYSLDMIINVLPEDVLKLNFLKIVIFDFIIGNTDRHQSNWAVLQNNDMITISPVYDNGSSLCAYINENNISSYLGKDIKRFNSLVDSKSRSRIRVNKYSKKEPTHLEVAKYIKSKYMLPGLSEWIKNAIDSLNQDIIYDLINRYDDNLLSKERKELLYKYITAKVSLLHDTFFGKEDI